jgi:Rho-binding antiterminator
MISCQQYDYIEVVCLYHYPLSIELRTGETVKGIAVNTVRNEQRNECIELNQEGGTIKVVLDNIARLTVTVQNPHIDKLSFI